jgi:REP element-mobilizing transposase RayT
MGDAYQIKDQYALHFLTFQVVGWMDIFSRQSYRDVVVDSFNFCRKEKHLKIRAWVIMSNHVHCILSSGTGRLSDTVGEMKGFTSREMLKLVEHGSESRKEWMLHQFKYYAGRHTRNEKYQLWTHENHAEELLPMVPEKGLIKLNYIRQNPVRAGIVADAEHYLYSSAMDYAGRKGLVGVDLMT